MLRFLKMDIIAGCLAVASLFAVAHRIPLLGTEANQTEAATRIVEKAFVAPSVAIKPVATKLRLPHTLRMLANLGIASWYGAVLEGHRTASGEIFHHEALTACHRTLPFGTMVKVVDVTSGRFVIVRINDRGVLRDDRIIDLSSGAAESLGILRAGVARVRLEVLKKVAPPEEAELPDGAVADSALPL